MKGEYEQAKHMFKEVFKAYTQIYGESHPSTINTMINLGTTLR